MHFLIEIQVITGLDQICCIQNTEKYKSVYIDIHMYEHMYVHVYIHICIYVYIYVL